MDKRRKILGYVRDKDEIDEAFKMLDALDLTEGERRRTLQENEKYALLWMDKDKFDMTCELAQAIIKARNAKRGVS